MLTPQRGLPAEIIKNGRIEGCKAQEGGLALLWTLGIFALNIGPVPMGPVLDVIGPRYTSILGAWRSGPSYPGFEPPFLRSDVTRTGLHTLGAADCRGSSGDVLSTQLPESLRCSGSSSVSTLSQDMVPERLFWGLGRSSRQRKCIRQSQVEITSDSDGIIATFREVQQVVVSELGSQRRCTAWYCCRHVGGCAGIVLNMVGLIVIAFCSRHGPLWLGAILIGLGGITFHLAQAWSPELWENIVC